MSSPARRISRLPPASYSWTGPMATMARPLELCTGSLTKSLSFQWQPWRWFNACTLQRFFVGHSQRITCLSYCSAWKLCASGQIDPKGGQGPFICLWRPADCILLTVLVCPLHEDQITSLCFSPDGNQLFSLARDSANTLAMWESFLPGKTPCGITSAGMELPHVYRKPVAKVATGKVGGFGMVGSKDAANFQVAIFDAGKTGIGLLLKFVHVVNGSELLGRSAIFPPSSAPRHVLNCAWMDGECLACGDNGYLYMFQ
ncbi:unnamed protein product, partial [Cladocopium goreaui]